MARSKRSLLEHRTFKRLRKILKKMMADLSVMMTRMNNGEDSPEQLEQIAKDWIADNQSDWDALIDASKVAN